MVRRVVVVVVGRRVRVDYDAVWWLVVVDLASYGIRVREEDVREGGWEGGGGGGNDVKK